MVSEAQWGGLHLGGRGIGSTCRADPDAGETCACFELRWEGLLRDLWIQEEDDPDRCNLQEKQADACNPRTLKSEAGDS